MKNDNIQHYIIFDINSSSIGTLVFERAYNEKLKKNIYHEVFTTRENITNGQDVNFETFFDRTIKTFESVAEQAHKYSGNNIAEIYLNVAAPWASSQKRIIHFEKEHEFIFTKETGDSIVEKEIAEPLHHTHDFRDHEGLALLERRTVDVYVNGYPTKNPYGKKGKDVDIHSLISVISEKTKNAFIHVVERAFHVEPKFFSNNFMTYQSLVTLFPQENDITCIDISGEVSEVNIIINDHLKKTGTIPVGTHHVVRYLAESLKIPYVKAESLIIMYNDNKLDDKYRKSIEDVMEKSFLFWFKNFYDFIDGVSREYIIPDTLCLLAPVHFQTWLGEWILKTEELGEHMHAQRDISLLDVKMLWRTAQKDDFQHITDDNLALCLDFVENFMLDDSQK